MGVMSRPRHDLRNRIAVFLRQYGRGRGRHDPNDRPYNREIEKIVKKMDPLDLDRLIREEDEEERGLDENGHTQ